jgi:hypothetical protein
MDTSPEKHVETAQPEHGGSGRPRAAADGPRADPDIGGALTFVTHLLLVAVPPLWAVAAVSGFWHHMRVGAGVWTAGAVVASACAGAVTYLTLGGDA